MKRRNRGEMHPHAKLTDRDVEVVRELHERYRVPAKELAEKFDVSDRHMRRVLRGERR